MAHLKNSSVVQSVFVLLSGGALAQAITFAAMPVVTRLYSPESLGILGTFMSIVAIALPFAALGYPLAIVLPQKDRDAVGLATLSILLSLITTVFVSSLLIEFSCEISTLLKVAHFSFFLAAIPIAMVVSVLLLVVENWAIRNHRYKEKAISMTIHSLFVNGTKVICGTLNPTAFALLATAIAGYAVHAISLGLTSQVWAAWRKAKPSYASIVSVSSTYRDFPLFRAPEQAMNAVTAGMPVIMLAAFFDQNTTGLFTTALAAMNAPVALLSRSITDVFYPRLATMKNDGHPMAPLITKGTLTLTGVGLPAFFVIALFGPQIFSFVFGSIWFEAGQFAQWLGLWMWTLVLNKPVVSAIPVLQLQKGFLVYSIASVTIRLGAMWLGYQVFATPIMTVAFFCAASALLNALLVAYVLTVARQHDRKLVSATSAKPGR